jgi:DinB superfamily
MQANTLLRQQFHEFHQLLEGTLADVTAEQAQSVPPGTANPVGATYAHVVLWEDMGLHGLLQGRPPLYAGSWSGRTGLSELPPLDRPGHWEDWSRRVIVDLPALRSYAEAVYQATDGYFATMAAAELEREIDLTAMGFGRPAAAWVVGNMLQNVALHCGEIAALKGLRGLPGYPVPAGQQREAATG